MVADIGTLPESRSAEHARHGRTLRRLGMVVLTLFLLAGATGQLGVRTASTSDLGGEVDVTVTHAAVTRAGLASPYRVVVKSNSGFDGPIHIAVDRRLFDRFDFQNFYPTPAKETADPSWVRYEFDPPPGNMFE